MTHLIENYRRFDRTFVSGRNAILFDDQGREYIDMLSGVAVTNVGHGNQRVLQRVQEQLPKLIHVSNFFHIQQQQELAQRIVQHSFPAKGFFCNSGAEANEAAVKLARLYSYNRRGEGNFHIVTLLRSFHGRTMAGISATGQEKVKLGFNPLLNGFIHVEPNDMEAMATAAKGAAAVLIELVQGESGVHPLDVGYVRELRDFCSANDILLMIDEVQTGIGRTGRMFAFQNYQIEPDVFTIAKGLGNGFPIGAMFAKEPFAAHMAPGTHGSTFGGNPLCCSAALGVLDAFESDRILEHVEIAQAHMHQICQAMRKRNVIEFHRGLGMMFALELSKPMPNLVQRCLDFGLIINQTAPETVRLLPPLTISCDEISRGMETLEQVITES